MDNILLREDMDKDKMDGKQSNPVPRPRDPPLPDEVLAKMVTNQCYMVADLVEVFEEKYDPARGTVRNRLEYLAEKKLVKRKKHANGSVTYRKI